MEVLLVRPMLYNEIKSEDIIIKQEHIDICSTEYTARPINILPTEKNIKLEDIVLKQEHLYIRPDGLKTDNFLSVDKHVKYESIEIKPEHVDVEAIDYKVGYPPHLDENVKSEDIEIKLEHVDLETSEYKCTHPPRLEENDPNMPARTSFPTTFNGENYNHSRLKLPSWLKKNTAVTVDFNKGNYKVSKELTFKAKREKRSIGLLYSNDKILANEGKRSKCSECSKGFNKQDNLSCHILKVHKKLKPYECLKCNKPFLCKKSFLQHTESCAESSYGCSECEKTFNLRSSLSHHILIDHIHPNSSSNCPHKCEACGSSYKSKSSLYQHFLSAHSEIQHSCSDCNRYFSCKARLSRHMHHVHKK